MRRRNKVIFNGQIVEPCAKERADCLAGRSNDWFLVNSKGQTIEVVFLDGMEEPEIFVQDMPNVGATFTADKVVWKLRHWWGRTPIDFRTLFGGVVA